jgi:XTP/dITP diphosphohydrolase
MSELSGTGLIIATHNQGKAMEFAELFKPLGIKVKSAGELGLDEPEETGETFEENALIKALAAAKAMNLPALADDSGLAVELLDGAPGVLSARLAGPSRDFDLAMKRVKDMLEERGAAISEHATGTSPTAKFHCVLALAWPEGEAETFAGEVAGAIVWPPRGTKGFGYDAIFQPHGERETFGEMDPEIKHAISHRADAFGKLAAELVQDIDDDIGDEGIEDEA